MTEISRGKRGGDLEGYNEAGEERLDQGDFLRRNTFRGEMKFLILLLGRD
jgi:hypothetical protein